MYLLGPLKQLVQELQFRCLLCLFFMNWFPTWSVSPMADHSCRSPLGILVFPQANANYHRRWEVGRSLYRGKQGP